MIVYRVCSKKEIDKILNDKNFKNVGAKGEKYIKKQDDLDLNNHKYEKDEYYMHFFPRLRDILYINPEKDMYLCYYDIPEETLKQNIGIGNYKDIFTMSIPVDIPEYLINTKDLDFNYLNEIKLITENISMVDFFEDETINKFLKTIYTKKKKKII